MNILRNTISWICLYLVGTLFFLTASTYVFFNVVNADNIKGALKEEGVYKNVVPAVLKTTADTNVSTGQLPLKEQWVQDAATKAFSADDLEQKTNTVVDSTFTWLDGETDKPTFSIDFTENKELFSKEVADYTQNRVAALPPCTFANIPDSIDPYNLTCKVPGISTTSIGQSVQQQINNDDNFLKNPIISSDNASLNPVNQTATENPFTRLEGLQQIYQNKSLLMWILPLSTLLFATAGLALALNRINGLKRLSRSFAFSAVSLLLIGLLLGVGFDRVIDTFAADAITSSIAGPVVTNLAAQAQRVYFIFAGIAVALSIGLYVGARIINSRSLKSRSEQPVL